MYIVQVYPTQIHLDICVIKNAIVGLVFLIYLQFLCRNWTLLQFTNERDFLQIEYFENGLYYKTFYQCVIVLHFVNQHHQLSFDKNIQFIMLTLVGIVSNAVSFKNIVLSYPIYQKGTQKQTDIYEILLRLLCALIKFSLQHSYRSNRQIEHSQPQFLIIERIVFLQYSIQKQRLIFSHFYLIFCQILISEQEIYIGTRVQKRSGGLMINRFGKNHMNHLICYKQIFYQRRIERDTLIFILFTQSISHSNSNKDLEYLFGLC